jgi:hypothetical protein
VTVPTAASSRSVHACDALPATQPVTHAAALCVGAWRQPRPVPLDSAVTTSPLGATAGAGAVNSGAVGAGAVVSGAGSDTGAVRTRSVASSLAIPLLAVITADPAATPVASPVAATVATAGFEDVQTTGPATCLPLRLGNEAAFSCTVSPMSRVSAVALFAKPSVRLDDSRGAARSGAVKASSAQAAAATTAHAQSTRTTRTGARRAPVNWRGMMPLRRGVCSATRRAWPTPEWAER